MQPICPLVRDAPGLSFSLRYLSAEADNPHRRAVARGDSVRLELRCRRLLGMVSLTLALRQDGAEEIAHLPMHWCSMEGESECYSVTIPTGERPCGLYFFTFCARFAGGEGVAHKTASDQGVFARAGVGELPFQLLIYEEHYPRPTWLFGGIIYHIFIDRFFSAGPVRVRKGALLNRDWENGVPQYPPYPGAPLANNMFFGGNLRGIMEKLPYLASLGVNCLYLSPLFEAFSNHKYDTGNYLKVDEMFGSEAVLQELIERAHRHGMRIMLDGVFNHTGDDSLYFNKYGRYPSIGAYQSRHSPYYRWYTFERFPDQYRSWWGISILPTLNLRCRACRAFFVGEEGVVAHYARLGIDGFRLDVADELENSFLCDIKRRLHAHNREAVLYGEVWEDASNKTAYDTRKQYFWGRQLDAVMNYPLRVGIISYMKYDDTDTLSYALCEVMQNCPRHVMHLQMNLLGSHDTERILTLLGGVDYSKKTNEQIARARLSDAQRRYAVRLLRLCYLILMTLPGIPTIYYGDETGMEGYKDPFNRAPFPWHRMDEALVGFFREMGEMRRGEAAFAEGSFHLLKIEKTALAFVRKNGSYMVLTVVNKSEQPLRVSVDRPCRTLYGKRASGRSILLGRLSGGVYRIEGEGCTFRFSR